VTIVEIILAVLFAGLGVRSVVHWARNPFLSRDVTDQVLFALFVTARAGSWFAFAGLFALYASMGDQGEVFVTVRHYDWYLLILLSLAALQFVSGFMLSRRTSDG
jgi:hypothetical protein